MISKRIKEIAAFIPPAKSIADIGCDHGYLIIEAFLNYNITYALAVDNKEKPLAYAAGNIKRYPFFKNVRFSLSSGLSDAKEALDVIILSGMGGANALNIIKKAPSLSTRLIIQANRNLYELRKGISGLNYAITREKIIKDGAHIFEIIEFTPGAAVYDEAELYFGPILMKEKSLLFIEKLKAQHRLLQNVGRHTPDLIKKTKMIEEILCK